MIAPAAITLGVLAGGEGARFGGADKAWLDDGGRPAIERCLAQFPQVFAARRLSARAPDARHAALGLEAVFDREPGFRGPVAGLAALARACATPWLLTVPVDMRGIPEALPRHLAAAADGAPAAGGACAVDAGGLQPLLALWRATALAEAADAALVAGDASARALVDALCLARVSIAPIRLRNLNTPADLHEARR